MTILSDLMADIADDCDDTTGEYGPAILKAVQGAQRDCERSTYYFNETRDETFVTVVGQDWYGAAANANIPTLVRIQYAFCEDSGQRSILRREVPEVLEILTDTSGSNGEPYCWTYFNQQIRLYSIPNAVYTIRLQLGPYRLIPLVNATDNNAWLDEAYDLLKERAKYRLYMNTLKDAGLASAALNAFNEQDAMLVGETTSRHATGQIRPTRF